MRVKRGVTAHKRHKKYLKMAKGYRGARSKLFRTARETVEHALCNAYTDRKRKKRDFRKLWIQRINAAARQYGMSYSRFMHGLNLGGITLNRKIIADMAVNDQDGFNNLIEIARSQVQ
jgi:large subunit ribosomal protein L20